MCAASVNLPWPEARVLSLTGFRKIICKARSVVSPKQHMASKNNLKFLSSLSFKIQRQKLRSWLMTFTHTQYGDEKGKIEA